MRRTLLPAAAVLLALTSCATNDAEEELRSDLAAVTAEEAAPEGPVAEPVEVATELVDPEGSVVGSATLRDGEQGTEVTVDVAGLTPGPAPMALHEVGTCAPAGGQPFGATGEPVTALPPLLVLEDGVGSLTTLVAGEPVVEELLAGDGTAVVVGAPGADPAAPPGSGTACGAFTG